MVGQGSPPIESPQLAADEGPRRTLSTAGPAPTAGEIASHLDLDRQEVVEAIIASSGYFTSSSDAPVAKDGDEGRTVSHTEALTPTWTRCSRSKRFAP